MKITSCSGYQSVPGSNITQPAALFLSKIQIIRFKTVQARFLHLRQRINDLFSAHPDLMKSPVCTERMRPHGFSARVMDQFHRFPYGNVHLIKIRCVLLDPAVYFFRCQRIKLTDICLHITELHDDPAAYRDVFSPDLIPHLCNLFAEPVVCFGHSMFPLVQTCSQFYIFRIKSVAEKMDGKCIPGC